MSRKIGDKDVWVRNFDVSQPTKHKKGFTVYKVVSTVRFLLHECNYTFNYLVIDCTSLIYFEFEGISKRIS